MHHNEIKKIVGELDLHRVQKKLASAGYGPVPVALGDLFACGCYFIQQGKTELGFKLCRTALLAYGVESGAIERIMSRIEGSEAKFSLLLNPHLEIPGWLFDLEENDAWQKL